MSRLLNAPLYSRVIANDLAFLNAPPEKLRLPSRLRGERYVAPRMRASFVVALALTVLAFLATR